MKFYEKSFCDNSTKRLITAVEQAVKEHISKNKIQSIVMLRDFSQVPRIKNFITSYNFASYITSYNFASYNSATDTNTEVLSLLDAKQWMDAIERGESVLDGIS